ncbi:MAG: T9SS type A sorting domain-containing protein [Flavobacteriaceae bacterium]|nr:T9SS type A sorting domain-containing protein [Flavobacteriaceae bacterium]
MKTIKIAFLLLFTSTLLMAQIPNDLMPTNQVNYTKITEWKIAYFPIDFTDIPAVERAKFPTKTDWERILFQEDLSVWYQDMSFGTTTFTGTVFDYTTSSDTFMGPGPSYTPMDYQPILDNLDFNAPGFDINDYNYIVFVTCHDGAVQQSITTDKNFTINGVPYSRPVVCTSYQAGFWWRQTGNYPYNDQLTDKLPYLIPTGTNAGEESDTTYPMSKFEGVLLHEIGHSMWLDHHANSSTNGNQPAYAPEIANNGGLLNNEYGNKFDIMGKREYGVTMNGSMRDFTGLLDSTAIYSKNWWGKTTITVKPLTAGTGKRFIEVLLPTTPDGLGGKNHGFGLEVRPINDYTMMMSNPLLSENTNGFFVHRTNGSESLLLDMSPSDNIDYYGAILPDLRDVVLKHGMTYEDDDVKFENVVDNGNGTWSIDITIKTTLIVTPAVTMGTATRAPNEDITITWTNNCSGCNAGDGSGSDQQLLTFEYRKAGEEFWNPIYDGVLGTETYTTNSADHPLIYGNTDDFEFRMYIGANSTHYASLKSNTTSTALGIDKLESTVFNIYPNPTNSTITVESAVIIKSIQLINNLGQTILEQKNNIIDLKNIDSGLYYLKINTDKGSFSRKIIKE